MSSVKELFSSFNKAMESQVFFDTRMKALEYIEKLGKVATAMLTVSIIKKKVFVGTKYEVKLSLLHSTGDGQVYQTSNFYKVELLGNDGLIPSYLLKELEDEESIDIKFNLDDLYALYEEREIKVDEESTFDEILEICKKKDIVAIKLIDRVFYTRIVCYDANKENVGAFHIGVLKQLPKNLEKELYPCGKAEYDIN